MKKHYRLNTSDARQRTRRDAKREHEEAAEFGFYTYNVLAYIPLRDIIHAEVWRPERIERVTQAIKDDIPLPAIQVDKDGSKYTIGDGIHRYNGSLQAGMTHIPAIYSVLVEAPELYKPPEPEKPALSVGAWVELHDPKHWGADSPWARVDEVLGTRMHKGVKRHLYSLIGIVKGEADFLGDCLDSEFEAHKPPPSADEEIIKRWVMACQRVASAFLGVPTR